MKAVRAAKAAKRRSMFQEQQTQQHRQEHQQQVVQQQQTQNQQKDVDTNENTTQVAAAAAAASASSSNSLLLREFAPSLLPDEAGSGHEENSFESAGLCAEMCAACRSAGWETLTRIQAAVIPVALNEQRDIVGIANTGSGKTAAFALPAIHWLLEQGAPRYFSTLVLVPTRELAIQVADQFSMIGSSIGLKVVALVGGEDMVSQAVEIAKRPHVVVGTPGRVADHLKNTRGFAMPRVKWFILDEADKMLDMDFEREIDFILDAIKPLGSATAINNHSSATSASGGGGNQKSFVNNKEQRQTMLFSATFSAKVDRLQRAALKNPVLLQVHRANTTVETLKQHFIFAPFAEMLTYLHVYLARIESGQHILVFCSSGAVVHKVTLALRVLGHRALPLMGRMSQQNRLRALTQFKNKAVRVLVCTDVAQRGLDIPHVDVVVNYSLPLNVKEYIHRVGRTARAGSNGKAVNFVSQYDIGLLQNIESETKVKMEEIEVSEEAVKNTAQRVAEAEIEAAREVKEQERLDKLEGEQEKLTGSNVAPRRRAAGDSYANNNNQGDDTKRTSDFGARRTRKENENLFQTTKKNQRKELAEKRRQVRR